MSVKKTARPKVSLKGKAVSDNGVVDPRARRPGEEINDWGKRLDKMDAEALDAERQRLRLRQEALGVHSVVGRNNDNHG